MEILLITLGFILHECFHIFLAIGGFAIIKKFIKKAHKCCVHKEGECHDDTTKH